MNAHTESRGRSALLKVLFVVVSALLLGAIAYSAWIVISYWDHVGV